MNPETASDFNRRAGKWWSELHRAAKARADRATGHKGWIAALAWEKQKRGLAHVHGVLSAGSAVELQWAKAYVEALRAIAQPKGFGFVDGWHKIGRKLWPGEQAGAYLSSYFVRGRGGKAPTTENVLAGDLPRLVVFVSRRLTSGTGCTMRNLRLGATGLGLASRTHRAADSRRVGLARRGVPACARVRSGPGESETASRLGIRATMRLVPSSDLELAASEAFNFLEARLGFERVRCSHEAYQWAYQSERVRVRLTYDPRGELDVSVEDRERGESYSLYEIAEALEWPDNAAPFYWMSDADKLAAGARHLGSVLREHGGDVLTGDEATFARIAEAAVTNREAWTRFYAGEGPDPRTQRLVTVDDADAIWNRACDFDFQPRRRGDRALKAVIQFHGLIMGGGMDYAIDTDFDRALPAVEGFRQFGAEHVAEVIERAHQIASRVGSSSEEVDILNLNAAELAELQALNERYDELLPSDSELEQIFRAFIRAHPTEFAPLS